MPSPDSTEPGKAIPQRGGAEHDAFSPGWRRCLFWQPGELRRVKRGYRRRWRKAARRWLKETDHDSNR